MTRLLKALVVLVAATAVFVPSPVRADGYISPFIGTNFGNNSGNGRLNVGLNAGWMGSGIVGAEVDFGYAPDFFGDQGTFGSNSVTDLMGNLIVGIPVGGTRGAGFRPYATIGGGLLRTRLDGPAGTGSSFSSNEAGINAGAGVMGFVANHVGFRGDVRYFRNLSDTSEPNAANVDFGSFHFWRASVGFILRP